jgi:hypothetical protein
MQKRKFVSKPLSYRRCSWHVDLEADPASASLKSYSQLAILAIYAWMALKVVLGSLQNVPLMQLEEQIRDRSTIDPDLTGRRLAAIRLLHSSGEILPSHPGTFQVIDKSNANG